MIRPSIAVSNPLPRAIFFIASIGFGPASLPTSEDPQNLSGVSFPTPCWNGCAVCTWGWAIRPRTRCRYNPTITTNSNISAKLGKIYHPGRNRGLRPTSLHSTSGHVAGGAVTRRARRTRWISSSYVRYTTKLLSILQSDNACERPQGHAPTKDPFPAKIGNPPAHRPTSDSGAARQYLS
jgi:hypothetical protein